MFSESKMKEVYSSTMVEMEKFDNNDQCSMNAISEYNKESADGQQVLDSLADRSSWFGNNCNELNNGNDLRTENEVFEMILDNPSLLVNDDDLCDDNVTETESESIDVECNNYYVIDDNGNLVSRFSYEFNQSDNSSIGYSQSSCSSGSSSSDSQYNGKKSKCCKRSSQCKWSVKEIEKLLFAVGHYGVEGKWGLIAKYVGSRNPSQCENKWRNSLSKPKVKWSKEASAKLSELMKNGASLEDAKELMPEYTDIQVYQHYAKLSCNKDDWTEEEIEMLVYYKTYTDYGETEIGKMLNNRSRDSVRSKWKEYLKSQSRFV